MLSTAQRARKEPFEAICEGKFGLSYEWMNRREGREPEREIYDGLSQ